MKLPSHPSSVLRLLAVAVMSATSAYADKVPTPASGSIFLGVRSDSSGNSYLVNLGPDTTFRNAAAGSSFEVAGLGAIATDLAAEFGPAWYSDPGVSWSIFGERTAGFVTTYGSKQRPSLAQPSAPYISQDQTARSSTSSFINGVIYQVNGYSDRDATANSTVATFQQNDGGTSSYARQVGDGTTDFGSLSGWSSIEGQSATGIGSTALDLYRFGGTASSNTVTNIGSFTISSSGVIRFAAPSPAAPADSDGDGFTDVQEVYAGTDPNNAGSFFSVTQVTPTPTGPRLQTPAAANRSYVVQYSPDLATAWQDIFTHHAGAGATALDYIDTDSARLALGRGFYRLKIQ